MPESSGVLILYNITPAMSSAETDGAGEILKGEVKSEK
jgi:hypothetical protein